LRLRSPTAAYFAGHAEPWAESEVVAKPPRWRGREDAPLLFRARRVAQWRWFRRFLRECLPDASAQYRALAGLAFYAGGLPRLRSRTVSATLPSRAASSTLHQGATSRPLARADCLALSSLGRPREIKSAAGAFHRAGAFARDPRWWASCITPEDYPATRTLSPGARHLWRRKACVRNRKSIKAIDASGDRGEIVLEDRTLRRRLCSRWKLYPLRAAADPYPGYPSMLFDHLSARRRRGGTLPPR